MILQVDQSIDDAREALIKTVEGFVNEPPSKEEVERGKARLLKQFDLNLSNSERIGLFLSEYEAIGGLAPAISFARSDQEGDGAGRAARGEGVPEGVEPYAGTVHSRRRHRTGRKFRRRRAWQRC